MFSISVHCIKTKNHYFPLFFPFSDVLKCAFLDCGYLQYYEPTIAITYSITNIVTFASNLTPSIHYENKKELFVCLLYNFFTTYIHTYYRTEYSKSHLWEPGLFWRYKTNFKVLAPWLLCNRAAHTFLSL